MKNLFTIGLVKKAASTSNDATKKAFMDLFTLLIKQIPQFDRLYDSYGMSVYLKESIVKPFFPNTKDTYSLPRLEDLYKSDKKKTLEILNSKVVQIVNELKVKLKVFKPFKLVNLNRGFCYVGELIYNGQVVQVQMTFENRGDEIQFRFDYPF